VSELLRAEIADLVLKDVRDPRLGVLVSVTGVEVTRDLKEAKVFVSVLGSEEEQVQALRGLQRARSYLRREVGKRLRLRHTPELQIIFDPSIERGARVLALMRELGLDAQAAPGEDAPDEDTAPATPHEKEG
jgi:ribosome-binding factor A